MPSYQIKGGPGYSVNFPMLNPTLGFVAPPGTPPCDRIFISEQGKILSAAWVEGKWQGVPLIVSGVSILFPATEHTDLPDVKVEWF